MMTCGTSEMGETHEESVQCKETDNDKNERRDDEGIDDALLVPAQYISSLVAS